MNEPVLRFPSFEDSYKKIKLGDYLSSYKDKTKMNNQYPVLTSSRKGLFLQENYFNQNVASENNTGYNIVPYGYFTYRHMSDDATFKFNINNLVENGIVSTLYPVFTTKKGLESNYLRSLLNEGRAFKKYCLLQKQGGSRTYMYFSKLEEFEAYIPSIDEQIKVVSLITLLDKNISKQLEKIDLLKVSRKVYIQKIFTKQLRFKDQDGKDFDDWKKFKLKDLLVAYNEKTTMNNQYPALTSSRRGLFLQSEYFNKQIASEDNTRYNIVPYGYFTYRHMSDDATFKFNINDIVENGIVSTLYPVFTTNEKVDKYFLKYFLNESSLFKKYGLLQQQGGSRTYMYFSKLIEFESEFPSNEEQLKIADFLKGIDNKIQKENSKYDLLVKQKQSLMQKMFI